MVRPAERRRIAEWACGAFRVTERRACAAVGMSRSTLSMNDEKWTKVNGEKVTTPGGGGAADC